ncbi:hypothetical protein [Streptomyces sp. B21-083]|uniref:hypothetical protein n=1 Tax=Streptomyces sp. B21-083 TaxID=3039410 RepID=UPI002FF3DBBF
MAGVGHDLAVRVAGGAFSAAAFKAGERPRVPARTRHPVTRKGAQGVQLGYAPPKLT